MGTLFFELDDGGTTYRESWSEFAVLNDGQPHRVVVRRTSSRLSIVVDCRTPELFDAPTPLDSLPPLTNETNDPCIDVGGVSPLEGSVTDICIRPL